MPRAIQFYIQKKGPSPLAISFLCCCERAVWESQPTSYFHHTHSWFLSINPFLWYFQPQYVNFSWNIQNKIHATSRYLSFWTGAFTLLNVIFSCFKCSKFDLWVRHKFYRLLLLYWKYNSELSSGLSRTYFPFCVTWAEGAKPSRCQQRDEERKSCPLCHVPTFPDTSDAYQEPCRVGLHGNR